MTTISVIVPTYNRAKLISETIDHVLAQTSPANEVIVVDDGSTDDTQDILARYGSRIRSIVIDNSGDLVARNTGLRASAGKLVAFCDSDDLWAPDFLAAMSSQWETEPGLTACYADFRILQDGVLSSRSKFDDVPPNYWSDLRTTGRDAGIFDGPIISHILQFQPFFPSCMMVSRQAFLDAGAWDEGVSRMVGCDLATTLRIAARPPIGVVMRPLVSIRKHASNFSGDTEKMNLGDARVLEHVLVTRPELTPFNETIRHSVVIRRCGALDSAFSRRDFVAVREIYRLLRAHGVPAKQRFKSMIAALPRPLGMFTASLLSR